MKVAYLSVGLLALLSPLTAAWSKEDREIFRIRDEISSHETDPSATFYDILGIKTSASLDEITKAYRTKTRSLHPDKVKQHMKARAKDKGADGKPVKAPTKSEINKAVKDASERQARLSLIANILRGPERDRYDHFLTNGFPLWKGTDYYYNRYRPGLGTAMFGVFLMGGGAVHYILLYMNWKRQKEFVERYIKFARDTAWRGNNNIPSVDSPPTPSPVPAPEEDEEGPMQPLNRKQRRMQERETKKEEGRGGNKKSRKAVKSASSSRDASAAPTGIKKRVVAENGKILVVDSVGDVYLEEQDEEGNAQEYLLDPTELAMPTIKDTAIVQLPLWVFYSTVGRFLPGSSNAAVDETVVVVDDEESDAAQNTPSTDSAGEDFEMLDKSTDSLTKATGAQQGGGKAKKRKGRK